MDFSILAIPIGVTVALVQVIKMTGIKKNLLPITSVITGILVTFLYSESISISVTFLGLIAGLAASGTYDLGTKTIKK